MSFLLLSASLAAYLTHHYFLDFKLWLKVIAVTACVILLPLPLVPIGALGPRKDMISKICPVGFHIQSSRVLKEDEGTFLTVSPPRIRPGSSQCQRLSSPQIRGGVASLRMMSRFLCLSLRSSFLARNTLFSMSATFMPCLLVILKLLIPLTH